jgi:drug/metabolite transporter (DMT)-like permease
MLGILFSLAPLIGWGAADYIASKYSRQLLPVTINLFFSAGATFITLIVCLFLGFPEITLVGLLQYLGISMLLTSGFLSMVKAFSIGATGVVAPIANSYAVLTAIISVVILSNEMKLTGVVGLIVIVIGIALLTYKKDPNHNKKDFERSVVFSIMALIFFGVGFSLFDIASSQQWYQNNMLFQMTGLVIATAIYIIWVKKDRIKKIQNASKLPLLYIGSIFGGLGAVGLFAAFEQVDNVAIPAAIAAAAPLVTAYMAYIYDKEHLTKIQRFASIVIVGGIVLLAI